MQRLFVFGAAGLFMAAGLIASCGDSQQLGLSPQGAPAQDAGVGGIDADAQNDGGGGSDAAPEPTKARILQVAPWPGRGVQIAVELEGKDIGADLPPASIEGPTSQAIAASVAKPEAQPGITAVLVVPAADPAEHADRIASASALINALPAGESVILLVARDAPVLMADRSTDRAHAGQRLLEIAPEAGRSAAPVLAAARDLLAKCGGDVGPLYRSLIVVGEIAADDPKLAVDPVQTFALTGADPTGPSVPALIAEQAARRAAIVRIGACAGLDEDAPFTLHVGGSIAKLTAPKPIEHLLGEGCDEGAASRDDYPYPSEIEVKFTDEERAIYEDRYATDSEDPFQASMILGQGEPIAVEAHLHGQGSLGCSRKSLTFHLDGPNRRLMPAVSDDHFFMISMCLDDRYFSQVWGERLMTELGLFPPGIRYVRLRIDGKSQGVYLMVQRPEDAARTDDAGVISVVRRGYDIKGAPAEVKYPDAVDDPAAAASALASYDELASIALNAAPEDIEPMLASRMDLDAYLRWLAVGSVLHNGDYIDEVFFYASDEGGSSYHRVMGWDLDDLFEDCHNNGLDAIADTCGLLYCTEAQIDQALVRSPEVYSRYQKALAEVLAALTPDKLKATMDAVRDELWQALLTDETCSAMVEMVSDDPSASTVAGAQKDIQSHMDAMLSAALARRVEVESALAACAP